MDKITEFVPVELIIINSINDAPDQYIKLLKKWVKTRYGFVGDDLTEVLSIGDEIKIIHWEWKYKGEYSLVIDISWYSGADETGVICHQDSPVFEIDSVLLRPLDKTSPLYSRLDALEHCHVLDCEEHDHCNYIYELYEELKEDLESEEVSEEEFETLLTEKYVHYSSDDASDVDEGDEEDL